MRRVYMVSYLRRVLSPLAVKLYASALVLWFIGREVWVAKVLENAPGTGFSSKISFFAGAVWNAELIVQILVLAALALGLWFLRDIFASRTHNHSPLLANF